jgi:hypothetical protein
MVTSSIFIDLSDLLLRGAAVFCYPCDAAHEEQSAAKQHYWTKARDKDPSKNGGENHGHDSLFQIVSATAG